jgi:hypothetical protein
MTTHNNWDEGAYAALQHLCIFAAEIPYDENIWTPIFDALGTHVRNHPDKTGVILSLLERAGVAALHELPDGSFSIDDMHKLLVSKQHDYGHENILHFGIVGVAVRLCDKIARMRNLLKRGTSALNEALTDTYMDILGYAAIALMLEDGSFELELIQDGK